MFFNVGMERELGQRLILWAFSKMAIAGEGVIRIENFKKYINSNLVVHLLVRFRVIWLKIAKVIQGWNGVMFRGPPCIIYNTSVENYLFVNFEIFLKLQCIELVNRHQYHKAYFSFLNQYYYLTWMFSLQWMCWVMNVKLNSIMLIVIIVQFGEYWW